MQQTQAQQPFETSVKNKADELERMTSTAKTEQRQLVEMSAQQKQATRLHMISTINEWKRQSAERSTKRWTRRGLCFGGAFLLTLIAKGGKRGSSPAPVDDWVDVERSIKAEVARKQDREDLLLEDELRRRRHHRHNGSRIYATVLPKRISRKKRFLLAAPEREE